MSVGTTATAEQLKKDEKIAFAPSTADFCKGDEIKPYQYKPQSKRIFPKAVIRTSGTVCDADNFLRPDDSCVRLTAQNGALPYIVLDMGEGSCGGYAVFCVSKVSAPVTVRISYSCYFDYVVDETFGPYGDYGRGTCQYLGVELPVLPANPYRYELYTVSKPDIYFFPLLQGQERFVRIQLDTPDSSIEFKWFCVENRGCFDDSPYTGYLLSNDDDVNRVWYSGTWTAQLATIPNGDSWMTLREWLLPRYIEQGKTIGYYRNGTQWRDYDVSFTVRLSRNPDHVCAFGAAVYCQDENNALVLRGALDGTVCAYLMKDGTLTPFGEPTALPAWTDNTDHAVKIVCRAENVIVLWDGETVLRLSDVPFESGSVGFFAEKEMWYAVKDIAVTEDNGALLLAGEWDLSGWEYTRTRGYLSDGAMRDRLLWTGDIQYASRNIYYASSPQYLRSSIYMMAENQTPEGYIHPSPYPSAHPAPRSGDYGPFPSSEFSAWFVPIVAEYLLYTGDRETVAAVYPNVYRNLAFVIQDVDDSDGLFMVRKELSKRVFSLKLGSEGKYTYTNILIYLALRSGTFIAREMGKVPDARLFHQKEKQLYKAIRQELFDRSAATFITKKGDATPCRVSNSFAYLCGLISDKEAIRTGLDCREMGKLLGLSLRAMLKSGMDAQAISLFRCGIPGVSWVDAQHDWRHPRTVSECMYYPTNVACGSNWNDKSHPDAAIADIFSQYLLGVIPDKIAFEHFQVRPHLLDMAWVKGCVPTPKGDIRLSWQIGQEDAKTVFRETLIVPTGSVATVALPRTDEAMRVWWNGHEILPEEYEQFSMSCDEKYLYLKSVPAGQHWFRTESAGDLYRAYREEIAAQPQAASVKEPVCPQRVVANTSVEDDTHGVRFLEQNGDGVFSSQPQSDPRLDVTLRLYMGQIMSMRQILLLAAQEPLSDAGFAGFPTSYTVDVFTEDGEKRRMADIRHGDTPADGKFAVELLSAIGLPTGRCVEIHITEALPLTDGSYGVRLSGVQVLE